MYIPVKYFFVASYMKTASWIKYVLILIVLALSLHYHFILFFFKKKSNLKKVPSDKMRNLTHFTIFIILFFLLLFLGEDVHLKIL